MGPMSKPLDQSTANTAEPKQGIFQRIFNKKSGQ